MNTDPAPETTPCEYQPPRAPDDVRHTKRKCTTHLIEFWETYDCPVGVVHAALTERLRVAEERIAAVRAGGGRYGEVR